MSRRRFRFTLKEVKELLMAAVVLGFIVAYRYPIESLESLLLDTAFMTLVVGAAFIVHESCHKLVAQSHGLWSEFRMWKNGLGLALLMKIVLGWTLIVPGAAYYDPRKIDFWGNVRLVGKDVEGKIAAAGPVSNMVLALLIHLFRDYIGILAGPAIYVNLLLAMFNLIPFPPLDGFKIMRWEFWIWVGTAATGWILFQTIA